MNRLTRKLIIPLHAQQVHRAAVPLAALYTLGGAGSRRAPSRITIRRLCQRRAALQLIAGTFNTKVTVPERLERQFTQAARMAATVPVKRIAYPHRSAWIRRVCDAILADLDSPTTAVNGGRL
jgi:hypothetical protein